MIFEVLLIVALTILNGLLSMSELAVVSARPARLSSMAEKGNPGAQAALELLDQPGKFLSAVQIGITLVGVLLGIGGGSLGVPMLTLHGRPIHRAVATAAGFGAVIALPSVLAFLFVPALGAPPGTVGSVNLPIFVLTIAMTLVTAPLGATLAHRTDPRRLRRIFAGFLMIVALNMLRKALL